MTNSISLWFRVKNNSIKLVCVLQLSHVAFEYDANCQEINLHLILNASNFCTFLVDISSRNRLLSSLGPPSICKPVFKLRCSTQHYLHQSQFSPHTATDPHGQNNTTSKLTTNYPHGSARYHQRLLIG